MRPHWSALIAAAAGLAPVAAAQTLPVVDFDGSFVASTGGQFFGSFNTDVIETSNTLQIDTPDFGGFVLPFGPADFNSDELQVRIRGRRLAGNVADSFTIALTDMDGDDSGPGLGNDNYQWRIPTGVFSDTEFTDIVYPLGSTPLSVVMSPGTTNEGDGVPNFGAVSFLLQSEFDIRNRLAFEIDEIVVEPVCLTATYYVADYGTGFQNPGFSEFGNPGVVTETDDSVVFQAAGFGGAGRGMVGETAIDEQIYQLRVTARLLPGNSATQFRVVLADSDGDDSAEGLGTENWEYPIPTAELNESTFTDVTIPILSGAGRQQNFNSTFDGDGVINFGLVEWFVQSTFDSTAALNVEIREIAIEPAETTPGIDFDVPNASLFTYGEFGGPGALTETPDGIEINATGFGGLGENDGTTREVDADTTLIEITGRALPGNAVTAFDLILIDTDGDDSSAGTGVEEYFYQFSMEDFGANPDGSVTSLGPIVTVQREMDPSFRQQGFDSLFDGDEIQNFGLLQWQFSSGSDADPMPFAFELVNVRLVPRLPLTIDPDLNGDDNRDIFDLFIYLEAPFELTNDGVLDAEDTKRFILLVKCACPS